LKEAPPAGPDRSSQIAGLEARRDYEKALESFATWYIGDSTRWIECAREFDQVTRRLPSSRSAWVDRLASLLLQGLRARLEPLGQDSPNDARMVEVHRSVKEALAVVKRWESRADYRLLLVELRNRGTELARRFLNRSEQQLRDGRPEEGMTSAEVALSLASATEEARARKLIEACKAEIAARNDRMAQEQNWAKIKALLDKHESIDVWVALARFEKRFPSSARKQEIIALRKTLEPEIRRQIPAQLKQCDDYARDQRFANYRSAVVRLETFPHEPNDRPFAAHRDRLAKLDADLEQRFAHVPKGMQTRAELVAVLEELAAILALNPDHPGALARREEAWKRARPFADKMLRAAELTARQPRLTDNQRNSQIRCLRDLLKLSPPGPSLDRARELLKPLEN
jgi:hypothetical protein